MLRTNESTLCIPYRLQKFILIFLWTKPKIFSSLTVVRGTIFLVQNSTKPYSLMLIYQIIEDKWSQKFLEHSKSLIILVQPFSRAIFFLTKPIRQYALFWLTKIPLNQNTFFVGSTLCLIYVIDRLMKFWDANWK